MPDSDWRGLALASRTALDHLGYPIDPRCFPDETEPCGGSFAEHCAAQMAVLKAVADHYLYHLGPALVMPIYGVTYGKAATELADCAGWGHHGGPADVPEGSGPDGR